MTNMSIGARLYGLILFLGLVVASVAAVALAGFKSLQTEPERFSSEDVQGTQFALTVHRQMLELRRYEKDAIINLGNEKTVRKYLTAWKAASQATDETLRQLSQHASRVGIETEVAQLAQSLSV